MQECMLGMHSIGQAFAFVYVCSCRVGFPAPYMFARAIRIKPESLTAGNYESPCNVGVAGLVWSGS